MIACQPEFYVPGLIRKTGLHLIWAQPGGNKTMTALEIVNEMTEQGGDRHLFRHPDLPIYGRWNRVLWIATEESSGALKYRALATREGRHGEQDRFYYVFAAGKPRVTLDDLPGLIEVQGPFNSIVLDFLTGLRPKYRDGQRVQWDLHNDAANEQCLLLRGLAEEHELAIIMLHHSDKTVKNYRGPTDWWASADVMLGLRGDGHRVKVEPQKNRDGRLLEPFYLTPEWDGSAFRVQYDGVADGDDGGNQLKGNWVGKVVNQRLRAASINHTHEGKASFHSLRATAASWLAEANKAEVLIGPLLGHKGRQTVTQRYIHISAVPDEVVKTLESLIIRAEAVDQNCGPDPKTGTVPAECGTPVPAN